MSKLSAHRRAPGTAESHRDRELRESLARTLPYRRRPRRWPSSTRTPAVAPLPGRVIASRYQLVREIGEGSCGTVFEATDRVSSARVAVKIASGVFAASAEGMARFQREAIAAARIGHDGIVAVLDAGRDADGLQYIVMEYLEGSDLASLIANEGPLPVDRALAIAAGVTDALAAAHRAGVVHRDLKPANVYLQRRADGVELVKIIDFGVSKLRHTGPDRLELTGPGHILGSPSYMAPEQARGMAVIDGRADVYALGILLYELLTGRPPFDGDSPMEVIHQQITAEPAPPSQQPDARGISRAIDELVVRALAKAPDDRYQSMDELAAAIDRERERERERGRRGCRMLGVMALLCGRRERRTPRPARAATHP